MYLPTVRNTIMGAETNVLKLIIIFLVFGFSQCKYFNIKCYCNGYQYDKENSNCGRDNTCTVTNGKCYKIIHKTASGNTYTDYGCFDEQESKDPFNCFQSDTNPSLAIYCCSNGTLCNKYNADVPNTLPGLKSSNPNTSKTPPYLIIIAVALVVAVLIAGTCTVVIICSKRKLESPDTFKLPHTFNDNTSSGAGLPLLVERTISRQIELQEVIGKGRFGEVYRGILNSSDVAVKKFSPRDETSWNREHNIFQTHMLRHANVLGFIAADNKDVGAYTELWIVSDYYKNGSLYDYLESTRVNRDVLLRMVKSIANGLSYLHIEIPTGCKLKPPIAHRDLKSKNILVKDDLECVIADFGHAVHYLSKENTIKDNDHYFTGTKRYMAPEVLNGTINRNTFESFSRSDVYSVSLVFWEVARRSDINGQNRVYELPYFDMVPSDPTPEIMRKVVCEEVRRPTFYPDWSMDKVLAGLSKIMEECWQKNAAARLTALRIKRKLMDLEMENNHVKHC